MRHFIFLDPLENLVIKKDSTLLFAHSLSEQGEEVHLFFQSTFYFENQKKPILKSFKFDSKLIENKFYLDHFHLTGQKEIELSAGDIIHYRIDPPFDMRYLRNLWILDAWEQSYGVKVINKPTGIMKYQEKVYAYLDESALPSFVGNELNLFLSFIDRMKMAGNEEVIVKPLDLFQGMGVERWKIDDLIASKWNDKVGSSGEMFVVQPFFKDISKGEIRSLYFAGEELGSILKVPKEGEFLANIAQGAQYSQVELSEKVRARCDAIAKKLQDEGVPWIAYDIMGDSISEVNLTCPGLLVEVSQALETNLADEIIKRLAQ